MICLSLEKLMDTIRYLNFLKRTHVYALFKFCSCILGQLHFLLLVKYYNT